MSDFEGHGNRDEDYEPDLLTLEDEAGEEHLFEVIDATDIADERYLAVAPYSPNPEESLETEATLLFMRVVNEGDEEFLDIVDEGEELHSVAEVFFNRLQEIYDIDLDDLLQEDDEE